MGKSKKQKKVEKASGKRRENILKERRKVLAKIAKDHDGYSSKGAKNVYISLFFKIICEHMFQEVSLCTQNSVLLAVGAENFGSDRSGLSGAIDTSGAGAENFTLICPGIQS